MLSATELPTFIQNDCSELIQTELPLLSHTVTLQHPLTHDEAVITVQTVTDSFSVVLREIQRVRREMKLFGFEIDEIIDAPVPF
jgi:hypothetical protein